MWSRRKWYILIACIWLQSLNGGSAAFASYSEALKLRLGFTQQSLNTVTFFSYLGSTFGVGPSLFFHYKVPSWLVFFIGLGQGTLGYFFTWAALSSKIKSTVWEMSVFQFLTGTAVVYTCNVSLVICSRIFAAKHRGNVVGLLQGFLGLGASITMQILPMACGQTDQVCIPWLLSWFPQVLSIPSLLLLFVFHREEMSADVYDEDDEYDVGRKLVNLTGILVLLAVYIFTALILQKFLNQTVTVLITGIILLSPSLIIVHGNGTTIENDSSKLLIPPCDKEQSCTKQALCSTQFWLLFTVFFIGTGTTGAIHSSSAQIGYALGYSQEGINKCVSLSSVMNCTGKICSGLISDRFIASRGTSRPVWIGLSMLGISLGTIWAAFNMPAALYIISAVVSFAEGSIWCLGVSTVSEVFGSSSFDTLLTILFVAAPAADYVFAVFLVGAMYDGYASRDGTLLCELGAQCFRDSLIVISLSCLLGALLSGVLAFMTRMFYTNMRRM